MTDIKEYRAWVRAVTRLSVASNVLDGVPFLGIGPEFRKECKDIWDRIDELRHKMESKVEEIENEMEEKE